MLAKAALGYGDATRGSYDDVDRRLIEWHEEALAALPPDDSVLRVRLLSRLSEDLYWARGDRRDALSREAVAMARRLGDPAALRTALYTRYYAVLGPGSLEERRANADEVLALATQVGDPEGRFAGHELRAATLMETDEVDRLDAEIDACARLADELRLPILRWRTLAFRASRALMSGRLDEAEQLVDAALAAFQPVPSDVALAVYGAQLFMLRYLQGRLAELEEMLRQYAAERTDPAFSAGLAFVYSELGKPAEARQQLAAVADGFEEAAQTAGYLTTLWLATHVAVAVGEPDQAAALYERLVPYAERTVTAAYALRMGGVATLLGMLATALGDCDTATRHFDAAVAHERRAASPPALALALREQAAMPRGRGTPGDADRARVLLDEALTLIDRFGLEGLRPREQALRDQWG